MQSCSVSWALCPEPQVVGAPVEGSYSRQGQPPLKDGCHLPLAVPGQWPRIRCGLLAAKLAPALPATEVG